MRTALYSFFLVMTLATSAIPVAFIPVLSTPVFAPRIADSNNFSLNWSGYALAESQGSVTSVSGSWVVPTITCGRGPGAYAAFWAGIDGFSSSTVEQAGVLGQCSGGAASYSAWYEFYPAASVTINTVTVTPGDTVSVTVTSAGAGSFSILLTDGLQSYTTAGTVSNAALSSAECITERPSIGGSITNLANFGIVNFGQDTTTIAGTCGATVSGVTTTFASAQEITMVSRHGGTVLAQPSGISTDGSSFSVTWHGSK
jgi:hypothetical protein